MDGPFSGGAVSQALPRQINLSITSHTNIGKTTMVRTLLRRDVGKVLDQAHVTDQNERFTWLETSEGERLDIWDTPGFGNSVQLLKLLKKQGNPIGWMIAHVWDRFKDRPLWCSQQALKNVRDEADVVLYLVNALEDPTMASGYIDPEMQLLEWLQKPVLVILNQIGQESASQEQNKRERGWQTLLRKFTVVQGFVALDSFSRCWVLEGVLLEHVQPLLPTHVEPTMIRLMSSWKEQNIKVFIKSMDRIAQVIAKAQGDKEEVRGTGHNRELHVRRAAQELSGRLDGHVRLAMQDLIEWHGLEGEAEIKIQTQLQDFTAPTEGLGMEEVLGRAALGGFGGAAAGTAAGAAIDAATGGMSLGLFALTGAFLGALGLAAWGKDIEGEADTIEMKWLPKFLESLSKNLLLRYLAVAHFGRGRGEFNATHENPIIWQEEIQTAYASYQEEFEKMWKAEDSTISQDSAALRSQLSTLLAHVIRDAFKRMYPVSEKIGL